MLIGRLDTVTAPELEAELEKIFDQAGIDCLEVEMGMLVRRKRETGYEWIIEI